MDSAVGMFPHKIGPLLQLLITLLSNKSTVKKVDFTHAQMFTHSTLPHIRGLTLFDVDRCTTFWIRCPSILKFTNISPMISSPGMMRQCGEDKHQNCSTLLVSFFDCYTTVYCMFLSHIIFLSQPSGTGQTNLWMPQGVQGQVMIGGEQGYVVRWDFSYSSWTLFTCEVEMLLHVVSTAGT